MAERALASVATIGGCRSELGDDGSKRCLKSADHHHSRGTHGLVEEFGKTIVFSNRCVTAILGF